MTTASEVGSVGQAEPTATTTPSMMQSVVTAVSPFIPGGAALNAVVNPPTTSSMGNWALVAVGAILALGALLISSKETVVQVASHVVP
jgi:hypothetical protein